MKVVLVMAVTLDGKISRHRNDPVTWTGNEDKKRFVRITRDAGVVIMGSRTFDSIGMVLPGRKNIVMTGNKERQSQDENLVFTDAAPEKILAGLEEQGFQEVALIGGSLINTLYARKGLIDELCVTVIPLIFGTGLSLFSDTLDLNLELLEVEQLDKGALFLRYAVT